MNSCLFTIVLLCFSEKGKPKITKPLTFWKWKCTSKDKFDISKTWDSPCNRSSCGLHKNSWEKGQFWLLCYIYSKICQIIWSLCLNTLFHILNLTTTWLHEKRLYLACSYLISNTLQDLYRNKSKIFQPANKRLRIQFSDIFSSLYNDAMIFSKSTAVIY